MPESLINGTRNEHYTAMRDLNRLRGTGVTLLTSLVLVMCSCADAGPGVSTAGSGGVGGEPGAGNGGASSPTSGSGGGSGHSSGGALGIGGEAGAASSPGGRGGDGSTATGGTAGNRDAGGGDSVSSGGAGSAGATGASGSGGTAAVGKGGSGAGGSGAGGATGNRDAGGGDSVSSGGAGGGSGVAGASGVGGTAIGGRGGSGVGGSTSFTPCPGAAQTLTVGSGQQYAKVQAAVDAVPSNNSKLIQIAVKAGTYDEQVVINKPFVCLTGESATTTIISHRVGSDPKVGGAVLVSGNDFSAANIAFQNTLGQGTPGGQNQAVALKATGQRQQFRNCRFLSYQDTLYTSSGTQYFRDCFIQGSVDYVFGEAAAVLENCTMNNVAGGSAVSAPRTPQNAPYGIVFLGGSLTANPTTSTVKSNSVHLGRPWGPYAAAAYLNVNMGAHIAKAGWTTMGDNTLALTRFWEYKSTGPGANPTDPTRASRQLTDSQAANYTVANVLGAWTPSYSR